MSQVLKPPATYTHAEALNWYAARLEEFAVGLRVIADDLEGCRVGPPQIVKPDFKLPAAKPTLRGRRAIPPPPNTLAHRVFSAREKAGMRREDLAKKAGLSVAAIAYIEHGRTGIHKSTLVLIANALDTTIEDLQGVTQ